MAIFPNLELEAKLQVDDRTRLDADKTFITNDEAAITLVEIEPEAAAGFITVSNSTKYLDWQYATDGTKTVTVRVTTDGAPVTVSKTIEVLTSADDKLFSSDAELVPYEPKILDYVRKGRNSFLDVHRTAQGDIFDYMDENGFWDINGDKLTKDDVTTLDEFKAWSKFMVLRLIFEGISNATDDIFHEKAERYRKKEERARDRAKVRIDRTNDGDEDDKGKDNFDFRSITLRKV